MRHIIAIALVFSLFGCGKKVSVAELKKLKEEACACKDKSCAEKVQKKVEDAVGNATEDELGKEGKDVVLDLAMCLGRAEAGLGNGK